MNVCSHQFNYLSNTFFRKIFMLGSYALCKVAAGELSLVFLPSIKLSYADL